MILLTGATGYIGGRLLKALEAAGRSVRCLARRPEHLIPGVGPGTQVVNGDVLKPESLPPALEGVDTAYYLVHSLESGGSFEEEDRLAARHFAEAAKTAGVRRVIYLGGLGSGELSSHLRSRQETGEVLREFGPPLIEFRASIVIGSGSLSFEMVRALVERLPVMVTPRWVATQAQPIAIEDLIRYLMAALDLPDGESRIFELGGADRVSYAEIMHEYARQRRLRRLMISVPVLTPRLSSLWLALITPLYSRSGRKIVEGLRNPTVVRDPAALTAFAIRPMGLQEAIARALRNEDREFALTRWSDALSSTAGRRASGKALFGSRFVDSRSVSVPTPPEVAFQPIRRIGGNTGWYYGDWMWRIRGLLDLLFGGVGVRRGRRDPETPTLGGTLDFWRVEAFEPNSRLRLAAEMKLPGRAWLEFSVAASANGSTIQQTAIFDPLGLAGILYWYALYPMHRFIFAGMLRNIAAAAGSGRPK